MRQYGCCQRVANFQFLNAQQRERDPSGLVPNPARFWTSPIPDLVEVKVDRSAESIPANVLQETLLEPPVTDQRGFQCRSVIRRHRENTPIP